MTRRVTRYFNIASIHIYDHRRLCSELIERCSNRLFRILKRVWIITIRGLCGNVVLDVYNSKSIDGEDHDET